ncbi:hypothetical protein GQ55_8G192900 [Panicum hallii var. hallii]|uniref:Knottin scorpion toxin-like domain-containing protein n=1 Tax=Panicum hallii var. hallii TaxID=1504633 RepID=A0A2T7CP41_9POAL|nr:hypothetical protein GQ55_8G192900 [Panicum hallii var. hallii]
MSSTIPSCLAKGWEICESFYSPCTPSECSVYCHMRGYKSKGAHCIGRKHGEECCCQR